MARECGLDLEAEYEFEIERLRSENAMLGEKLAVTNDLMVEARPSPGRPRCC